MDTQRINLIIQSLSEQVMQKVNQVAQLQAELTMVTEELETLKKEKKK